MPRHTIHRFMTSTPHTITTRQTLAEAHQAMRDRAFATFRSSRRASSWGSSRSAISTCSRRFAASTSGASWSRRP